MSMRGGPDGNLESESRLRLSFMRLVGMAAAEYWGNRG